LEARMGIEPTIKGFAKSCLITWPSKTYATLQKD